MKKLHTTGFVNQPQRFGKQHKNSQNEKLKKIYFKSHGCSMLLFDNITAINARGRINALKAMYNDWKGSFIITQ